MGLLLRIQKQITVFCLKDLSSLKERKASKLAMTVWCVECHDRAVQRTLMEEAVNPQKETGKSFLEREYLS